MTAHQWYLDNRKDFKKAYNNAKLKGITEFTFKGHEFYVPYAKYLIQYGEQNA